MELKKLSASSLQSADMCLARYYAEQQAGYNSTIRNVYAMLGSSVHGALEDFVKVSVVEKKMPKDLRLLKAFYDKHFMEEFNTSKLEGDWYETGLGMLENWFDNSDFRYFEVVSLEQKKTFHVQTSIGPIPLNYIIDRFDRLGDGVYRVVDYKTSNEILTPDLLSKKIQARIYALATQIELKENPPDEIWVEFNMLRFKPVHVLFTREDNVATYRMLQRAAERIIAAQVSTDKELEALETLNPQCLFCIRKISCAAVKRNIDVGGIMASGNLHDMVNMRGQLEFQRKAAEAAANELEALILSAMEHDNVLEVETDLIDAKVEVYQRKDLDIDRIVELVGLETFKEYGGRESITVANFDKLCKAADPGTAAQLRNEAVGIKYGEPKLKVKIKGDFIK